MVVRMAYLSSDGDKEIQMSSVENLFNTTINEIESMLKTKTVVGEPITIEGNTLIPLVSVGFGVGFGFGAGGGEGSDSKHGTGTGSGTGGGGGVKPVALIIVNKDGVRVETIKGGAASALQNIAETVAKSACCKHHESAKKE